MASQFIGFVDSGRRLNDKPRLLAVIDVDATKVAIAISRANSSLQNVARPNINANTTTNEVYISYINTWFYFLPHHPPSRLLNPPLAGSVEGSGVIGRTISSTFALEATLLGSVCATAFCG